MDWAVVSLVIIGGINWGLVGAFGFNLVESLFGNDISAIVYTLVGLSALYMIYSSLKAGQMSSMQNTRDTRDSRESYV